MKNFLVSFYAAEGIEPTNRVLVRQSASDGVIEKAKKHFVEQGVLQDDLSYFTKQDYGQAKIEGVDFVNS